MSTIYVALGVAFCAVLCVHVADKLFKYTRSDVWRLPGPSATLGSWLWGHEKYAFDHNGFATYTRWALEFGPVYKLKAAFFHPDIIVLSDHAAVHHVFQEHDDFVKAPQIRAFIHKSVGGENLIAHEHGAWRRERKLLAPAFSTFALKSSMLDIVECTGRLEKSFANMVVAGNGEAIINISHKLTACALDIIGRTSFGHDFEEGQSSEAQAIIHAWNAQVAGEQLFTFQIMGYVFRAFPFLIPLPIPLMRVTMTLKEKVNEIAEKLLERGEFNENGRDALSILVRANDGDKLSRQELIDNMVLLILAGSETTAGTASFTLLELARNPAIQNQLRQELQSLDRDMTYDSIQKLQYLDAVVKEGLRLHSAASSAERTAVKDCVIPLSDPVLASDGEVVTSLSVKAGQLLQIHFKPMHLNTKVWGPNAAEFVPERWITAGGVPPPSELPYGWSGLISFADGPRMCLGYRLALLEMKVVLATLIRTFDFDVTEGNVVKLFRPTVGAATDGHVGMLPLKVSFAP